MSSRQPPLQGYGAPINPPPISITDLDDDPTLESCCRREIESNRRAAATQSVLSLHDRIALAERRRRLHILDNLAFGSGCRCSYGMEDGGEYQALVFAREGAASSNEDGDDDDYDDDDDQNNNAKGEDETACAVAGKSIVGDDSSSSDDEFDYLLDEESGEEGGAAVNLRDMEEERRLELEMSALHLDSAMHHGYGVHRQMHPGRILQAAGIGMDDDMVKPAAAVVHLYDPESMASAKLDLCLEGSDFAGQYRGTKFLRSNGKSAALIHPELFRKTVALGGGRELQPDRDLPCVLAVSEGCVVAVCPRLAGLVGGDVRSEDAVVDERALEDWLDRAGVLIRPPPHFEELCRIRPEEEALYQISDVQEHHGEEYYQCGVLECEKTFPHEHVGVKNDQQDGLLVPEQNLVDS